MDKDNESYPFFVYNCIMGKRNIWEELKSRIGSLAFNVFIWSIEMTEEEYFDIIYEQEKRLKEKTDEFDD
jgi:hypothetical protein